MRLSSLNPFTALFGPVFQKEVRTSGRKRGTYVLRGLYGGLLLALIAIAFAGIQSDSALYTGVRRLQRLQTLAPSMAIMIVWFQFIALCLAAPIFTGPVICDEKRARTLPALMTTPLTAAQIILGTLTSRVVQLIILALMATPLLLAIRVFGGLNASVVLAATAMGISAALLGAALGLMLSVWHKRGTTAAVFALLMLALAMGGPSAVEGIIYFVVNESGTYIIAPEKEVYPFHVNILGTCTPAVMGFLTAESAIMGRELRVMEFDWITIGHQPGGAPIPLALPMWAVNTAYNLVLAGLATVYSTRALRRVMLKEAGEGGQAQEAPSRPKKKRAVKAGAPEIPGEAMPEPQVIETLPDGVGREAARSREVSDRPILWREVRQASFGSRRRFRIVALLAVLGMVGFYWWAGMNNGRFSLRDMLTNEGLHGALMFVGAIAIMLQPVFMTTGSVAGEREARTWETLLTTPLTGRAIMLGKLAGTLRTQLFLPGLVLLHFVLVAGAGYINPIVPVLLMLTYLGPTLLFSATGQLLSLFFRRAVIAAACNLLLALGLWLGTWIGLALGAWFLDTGSGQVFDITAGAFYSLNPVAMAFTISGAATRFVRSLWPFGEFTISGGRDHTFHTPGFVLIVLGVFAFYSLTAAGVLWLTVRSFRRLSGRSS